MNAVASSAVARTLSFVPTALATLLTSRLIIHEYGVPTFDSYALVLSLILLVPLNNLGVGAAVTSAFAAEGPSSERSRRTTLTAARVLAVSTVITAATALLLSATGAWTTLLGTASGPDLQTGVAVAVYALSFLPGLGTSMLLGVHRNHVTVLVQTLFTPLALLGTVAVILTGVGGTWTVVMPPAAVVVVNVITAVVAGRATGVSWAALLRELPDRERNPGTSIRSLSGPVLVITLAVPVMQQSDRIVLSHVSTVQAVADYSVAMQIFAPVAALVAATAQPLFPIYERARAAGRRGPILSRITLAFAVAAALICLPLVLLAAPVGHVIGGAQIDLSRGLTGAAAGLMIVQAAAYPIAMKLMNPSGARFVALGNVVALPLNVGLSVVLGRAYGAPGPLVASLVVVFAVQILPAMLYDRRTSSVGRHRAPAGRDDAVLATLVDLAKGDTAPVPQFTTARGGERGPRQAELATDG